MEVCRLQHEEGRFFLCEPPWSAWSWYLDIVAAVGQLPGVVTVKGHQCGFGQGAWGKDGWGPVAKATGWMTNSLCVAQRVGVLCTGDHEHVHLVSGCANATERYPVALVKAILKGIRDELGIGRGIRALEVGVTAEEPETIERATASQERGLIPRW